MKLYKLESSDSAIVSCYKKTISAINIRQESITVTILDENYTAICNVEVIENTSEVDSINLLNYDLLKEGFYNSDTGVHTNSSSHKCFEFIPVSRIKK